MSPHRLPLRSFGFLLVLLLNACGVQTATQAAFFYEEYCPSCEDYVRAEDLAGRLLWIPRSGGALAAESHNLIVPGSRERLADYVEEHGFPDVVRSVPVLFVGEFYFVGYDEIEQEILRLESAIPPSGLRGLLTRRRRAEPLME